MATTKQYLDYTGLQKLVTLIKSKFLLKSDAETTYLTDVTVSNNTNLVTRTPSASGAKTIALDFSGLSGKLTSIENSISGLSNAVHFVGVTTTALTDNATTTSIKINNADHTAAKGDVAIYGAKEFVFDGTKWHELGDTSAELNAINNLTKDLYGEGGTMTSPKDGSFVKTVKGDLSTLKSWQDNHVGHDAIPSTGETGSVEAAWKAAGLTV